MTRLRGQRKSCGERLKPAGQCRPTIRPGNLPRELEGRVLKGPHAMEEVRFSNDGHTRWAGMGDLALGTRGVLGYRSPCWRPLAVTASARCSCFWKERRLTGGPRGMRTADCPASTILSRSRQLSPASRPTNRSRPRRCHSCRPCCPLTARCPLLPAARCSEC